MKSFTIRVKYRRRRYSYRVTPLDNDKNYENFNVQTRTFAFQIRNNLPQLKQSGGHIQLCWQVVNNEQITDDFTDAVVFALEQYSVNK